jgi:hypothetical protein
MKPDIYIEGRRVYLNTRGTQTVKVCSEANVRTQYDRYYRIPKVFAFPKEALGSNSPDRRSGHCPNSSVDRTTGSYLYKLSKLI